MGHNKYPYSALKLSTRGLLIDLYIKPQQTPTSLFIVSLMSTMMTP